MEILYHYFSSFPSTKTLPCHPRESGDLFTLAEIHQQAPLHAAPHSPGNISLFLSVQFITFTQPRFNTVFMFRTTCFAVISLFFLLAGFLQSPAQNQKFTVSGSVSDAVSKQPLPNVNISVVGTSGGGTTNAAGEFSLILTRIPSVLYFSFLGYSISSYQVEKANERNIRILLQPETKEIEEVTIRAERISKVILGDTLNVVDYEIIGNRIIMVANPYRNQKDQRIYLTDLNGDNRDILGVSDGGKEIKIPEIMVPQTLYLFKDFTGQVHFLDKVSAREVLHENDTLSFGYPTQYPDFISRLLPMKCEMSSWLVFQVSTNSENYTYFFGPGHPDGQGIKTVKETGGYRYITLPYAPNRDFTKNVSAPLIFKNNQLLIFDFFANHIEYFDSDLKPIKKVPITFQNHTVKTLFGQYEDLDNKNFTQHILFDERTGKAYAFFRLRSTNRQSLREVNLETGKIDRIIEIPDYPNIAKIQVHDNVVYFLYDTKIYPFYRLLYRMTI